MWDRHSTCQVYLNLVLQGTPFKQVERQYSGADFSSCEVGLSVRLYLHENISSSFLVQFSEIDFAWFDCRNLGSNHLEGLLPAEMSALTALSELCD